MRAAVALQPLGGPDWRAIGMGVYSGAEVGTFVEKANKNGCGLPIKIEVTGGGIDWYHSDGREVSVVNAKILTTNLESGTSYLQTSTYHRTVTARADGTYLVVIDGSRWMSFAQGEAGPYGTVGRGSAQYIVNGLQRFVVNSKGYSLSYSVSGQVLDACALLA